VTGGLTAEESIEIMMLAGHNEKISSVDISDYNPSVEDFRTGKLVANMVYYFMLGFTARKSFG
jgi:formiminoglutamase